MVGRVAGQLEVVEILAERVRNEFRRVRGAEVLAQAKGFLPDGHLRVYLRVAGLLRLELREAYTQGELRILFMTEQAADCVYAFGVPLASFR